MDEPYTTEIKGFGEVYEVMSVERLRKKLLKRYGANYTLYLVSLRLGGFVDCPPWNSKPRAKHRKLSRVATTLARFIFAMILPLERFNKPHMMWMLQEDQ